jgi:uncharacterized protein (DUF1786 family)
MPDRVRVLAVDIGTGTQDILLFDSERTIENCYHLILPSPTVIVAERIRRATAAGHTLVVTGRTMGGGPSAWALRDHALAGLPTYATADAARTLDDDLEAVERLGIRVVSEEAAAERAAHAGDGEVCAIVLRDFDGPTLRQVLALYGIDPEVDLVAVAAFDHGAAPPGYSDRRFRFDYIRRAVASRPEPVAFAYRHAELPPDLTRLAAVGQDAAAYGPDVESDRAETSPRVLLMDTGSAAVVGALDDPHVRAADEVVIANVGNFHTLAFHLRRGRVRGLFEHHTGELTVPRLEALLGKLVAGTLTDDEVFADSGHGALVLRGGTRPAHAAERAMPLLAVTGPRRGLLRGSALQPYEAVPHGDMMLAGCFGLVRAVAASYPDVAPAIEDALGPAAHV